MTKHIEDQIKQILFDIHGKTFLHLVFHVTSLQGGTLADVKLVKGTAVSEGGMAVPFELVWKVQKIWERYQDPGSWRREFDLYQSDLQSVFTDAFRPPLCYHAAINDNAVELWLEYIDASSGSGLTVDMYEEAAYALGCFQGRISREHTSVLQDMDNLSSRDYVKAFYDHYRSWGKLSDYLRSAEHGIPPHLCQMLIEFDRYADEAWIRVQALPITLCHRDYWVENIFCTDNGIRIIDWDTAGWGYIGEDIASLLADEADVTLMLACYRRCIPAYYRGLSLHMDKLDLHENCIVEMILFLFAYRLIESHMFAETAEDKALAVDTLQEIYRMQG